MELLTKHSQQIAALGTAHVTRPARWKPRHHGASN